MLSHKTSLKSFSAHFLRIISIFTLEGLFWFSSCFLALQKICKKYLRFTEFFIPKQNYFSKIIYHSKDSFLYPKNIPFSLNSSTDRDSNKRNIHNVSKFIFLNNNNKNFPVCLLSLLINKLIMISPGWSVFKPEFYISNINTKFNLTCVQLG